MLEHNFQFFTPLMYLHIYEMSRAQRNFLFSFSTQGIKNKGRYKKACRNFPVLSITTNEFINYIELHGFTHFRHQVKYGVQIKRANHWMIILQNNNNNKINKIFIGYLPL